MIEHFVTNINILIFLIALAAALRGPLDEGSSTGYNLTAFIYFWQSLIWEWVALKNGVGALKHLNPSWDLVDDGHFLCPSLFYSIGFCSYSKKTSTQMFDEDYSSSDDIKEEN